MTDVSSDNASPAINHMVCDILFKVSNHRTPVALTRPMYGKHIYWDEPIDRSFITTKEFWSTRPTFHHGWVTQEQWDR